MTSSVAQRRMSAVDIASTLPTHEIHSLMIRGTHASLDSKRAANASSSPPVGSEFVQEWDGWLVLPGNHRESAAFHVGLIASLMQRGMLHRVKHVCAQGYSAVVAMALWANWHELCQLRDEADILATWITSMQAVLTQPAMHLQAALRVIGITDTMCFDDQDASRPRLHLCVRVDPDSSAVYCYDASTFQKPTAHFVLLHLLGIQRYYDIGSDTTDDPISPEDDQVVTEDTKVQVACNRFARGVQVRASTWAWLLELMGTTNTASSSVDQDTTQRSKSGECVWFVSTAHSSDEQDLFDEARMRVYHSSQILWVTIPYQIHRGNPAAVARGVHRASFEAPLEIPSSMSISHGMIPEVMVSLIRWGRVCATRKLNLLGVVLDPAEYQGPWTTFTRCIAVRLQALPRSNSWSSQQQSRILALLDDGEGDCRAMERDVQVTRQPQYHQAEWDRSETWRENATNPDHTARELSRQLVFFNKTSELTPRWPSQIQTPESEAQTTAVTSHELSKYTDAEDSDMESILQDVEHAEHLRNTYYETITQHIDVNRARTEPSMHVRRLPKASPPPRSEVEATPTVCQTFCSWLRNSHVKPNTKPVGNMLPVRPPIMQRPHIPRLKLPNTKSTTRGNGSKARRGTRGNRRRTHQQRRRSRHDAEAVSSYDTESDASAVTEDELADVAFDSFYVNVEQDGGPTTQIAERALSRRANVLESVQVRTPRKPRHGVIDFVQTQQNLRH